MQHRWQHTSAQLACPRQTPCTYTQNSANRGGLQSSAAAVACILVSGGTVALSRNDVLEAQEKGPEHFQGQHQKAQKQDKRLDQACLKKLHSKTIVVSLT